MIKYKIWAQLEKITTEENDVDSFENVGDPVDVLVTESEELARDAFSVLTTIADGDVPEVTRRKGRQLNDLEKQLSALEKNLEPIAGELVSGISFRTSDYGRPIEVTIRSCRKNSKSKIPTFIEKITGTVCSIVPIDAGIYILLEMPNGTLRQYTVWDAEDVRFLDHNQENTCDTLSKE